MIALVVTALLAPPPEYDRLRREVPFERQAGNTPAATTIYLPPGYAEDVQRRYPVLVLLHGLQGTGGDWIDRAAVHELLDAAIGRGEIEPLIALMPNGDDGYWVDWPDGLPEHRYGSLVEPDLTTWADAHLRTDGRRAILGISMGGFGALSIALKKPSRYRAAISLSGALFSRPPNGRRTYLAAFGTTGAGQWRFAFENPIDLIRMGQADHLPIWLDCGRDDRAKFVDGLKAASKALKARRVRHVARFRPGKHSWKVWAEAFADTLPWLQRQWAAP